MKRSNPLPIEDWSLEGRQQYIKENRDRVVLVIERALEVFDDEKVISKVFRSEEKAVEDIIKRFLVPDLNPEKVPAQDLTLFTEIKFWIKHKTNGRAFSKSTRYSYEGQESEGGMCIDMECFVDSIARTLKVFNDCVASDLIWCWLQGNKKLLNSLIPSEILEEYNQGLKSNGSPAKLTRYKADACFRFLYVYLRMRRFFAGDKTVELYERKYLTKGDNKPQYTFSGYEGHIEKQKIRRFIMAIIDQFLLIQPDASRLDRCLFSTMAKKTLIEHYEINGQQGLDYKEKISKLRSLKLLKEPAL